VRGGLRVFKPLGISSFDVIRSLRSIMPRGTVLGHAGTLDPAAEGLLLVLVNEATRVQHLLKDLEKTYIAVVRLGVETDTLDAAGKVTREVEVPEIEAEAIKAALGRLEGKRMQKPPVFSAIKVEGRRSYERARRGEEFELPERQVEIKRLELVKWRSPLIEIRSLVSSGTYIRSLSKEIGEAFSLPASLEHLKRTHIGGFSSEDALGLEGLTIDDVERSLLDLRKLLAHIPQFDVDEDAALRLLQGKTLEMEGEGPDYEQGTVAAFSRDGSKAFLCKQEGRTVRSQRLLYNNGDGDAG
jgi:tRNA pseudouridine55 synthase